MVLHTDQPSPHVHMAVKDESEFGHRLHIDKPMLRQWREDFAQAMREQGGYYGLAAGTVSHDC